MWEGIRCASRALSVAVPAVVSMMAVTLPTVLPIVMALGYDPIWFGIIVIKLLEIGLITPPIGLNVFVVKSVLEEVPLGAIFRGIMPFFFASLAGLALILVFPEIATLLPSLMR